MPVEIVPIGQQFLNPPANLYRAEALPANPYTGTFSLTRPLGPIPVAAFGLAYAVEETPPGIGYQSVAGTIVYDREILWIKTTIELLVSSLIVPYGLMDTRVASGLYQFGGGFPNSVEVTVYPGVSVNLWWLGLA